MYRARHAVYQTAHDFHAAAARYFRAQRTGQDMESATQELLGRSVFYDMALRRCAGADSVRRLRSLRLHLAAMNERYARQTRRHAR